MPLKLPPSGGSLASHASVSSDLVSARLKHFAVRSPLHTAPSTSHGTFIWSAPSGETQLSPLSPQLGRIAPGTTVLSQLGSRERQPPVSLIYLFRLFRRLNCGWGRGTVRYLGSSISPRSALFFVATGKTHRGVSVGETDRARFVGGMGRHWGRARCQWFEREFLISHLSWWLWS